MAGSFGYELDLNQISEEEKQAVKSQVARFKKYGDLIHNGLYYRISNPMKEEAAVWEYVSEDKSEAFVHGMIFRTAPNSLPIRIRLRGLVPDAVYCLTSDKCCYTGRALMNGGILLPKSWGDYFPIELHFTLVRGE